MNKIKKQAVSELIEWNIFTEYNALKKLIQFKENKYRDYSEARLLMLWAIIRMAKFDPYEGDMTRRNPKTLQRINDLSDEDRKYWKEITDDIKKAGELLYKFDGMNGMHNMLVWSFIPDRYHRQIEYTWDGIGDWNC